MHILGSSSSSLFWSCFVYCCLFFWNVCSEQGGFPCYVFEQAQHKGVSIHLDAKHYQINKLVWILFVVEVIKMSLKCHLFKFHIYEFPFQCAFLVESLKQRSVNQSVNPFTPEGDSNVLRKNEKRRPHKLSSPKPTALSLARMVWNGPIFKILRVLIRDSTQLSDVRYSLWDKCSDWKFEGSKTALW